MCGGEGIQNNEHIVGEKKRNGHKTFDIHRIVHQNSRFLDVGDVIHSQRGSVGHLLTLCFEMHHTTSEPNSLSMLCFLENLRQHSKRKSSEDWNTMNKRTKRPPGVEVDNTLCPGT